ncbi:MAG TPA: universal stress protein [Candidatus Bathyarchaeia archaeon]|nr:universal stress protein [Candidatus Bathyarchaeia archaeon]
MRVANILIGSDGSALMEAVFDESAYLARLTGATIHIAYVLDITGFGAQPLDASWQETYVVVKSEARRILDEARKALTNRRVPETALQDVLLEGHPAEELDAYARSHAIDLIIVGAHSRKGLDRLLIGNVTDKIVRTASVPVMVVHGT